MASSTLLIGGLAVAAVAYWMYTHPSNTTGSTTTTKTNTPTTTALAKPTIVVPKDINQQMIAAWYANGHPSNREAWISIMMGVLPLSRTQWGYVSDANKEFHDQSGSYPDDQTEYAIVNQALGIS